MTPPLLKPASREELLTRQSQTIDPSLLAEAQSIVSQVRQNGLDAVLRFGKKFSEITNTSEIVLTPDDMRNALETIPTADRAALERAADRIRTFAQAQRDAIKDLTIPIPGGEAGHTIIPIANAGCYAPGGRYPLPSSVLMTAIPASVAGCERVVVASPARNPYTLAAASIAGADEYLSIGGAHAIASLAYGFKGFAPCDVIAGPGNKWVTAAKHIVSDVVGIDMLAGPSELLIVADSEADPRLIAADLLAQAEHDDDAIPMLIATSDSLIERVETELLRQLESLTTHATARAALRNGFAHCNPDLGECIELANAVAAEHVQIMTANASDTAASIQNAGAVFIGELAAEVLGDYGAGPNHTLPTGGTARFRAGLSVMDFVRMQTWIRLEDATQAGALYQDTQQIARIERLTGHENAASARLTRTRKLSSGSG
ncbi:MAG: histidinol dehydrogenase [Planctomycetota bacterium]|jgi:phosphoribosyl-ATP pyrophosphohydrolase/phosphoribosyl-AMP cyclohydrolase/histidinol dehydrogenase